MIRSDQQQLRRTSADVITVIPDDDDHQNSPSPAGAVRVGRSRRAVVTASSQADLRQRQHDADRRNLVQHGLAWMEHGLAWIEQSQQLLRQAQEMMEQSRQLMLYMDHFLNEAEVQHD